MQDILIALLFVAMVSSPALVSLLRVEESEKKPNGLEGLSVALANAKHACPASKGTSSFSGR
jgi:hypothetical protein